MPAIPSLPHVDWSPGAGAVWLAAYVGIVFAFGVYAMVAGYRAAPAR